MHFDFWEWLLITQSNPVLFAARVENLLRKISLPHQCRDCPESVALGAGVVAAASRENYGKAPPPEVARCPQEISGNVDGRAVR